MPRAAARRSRGVHRTLFGTWFGMALDDETIEAIVAGWSHKLRSFRPHIDQPRPVRQSWPKRRTDDDGQEGT